MKDINTLYSAEYFNRLAQAYANLGNNENSKKPVMYLEDTKFENTVKNKNIWATLDSSEPTEIIIQDNNNPSWYDALPLIWKHFSRNCLICPTRRICAAVSAVYFVEGTIPIYDFLVKIENSAKEINNDEFQIDETIRICLTKEKYPQSKFDLGKAVPFGYITAAFTYKGKRIELSNELLIYKNINSRYIMVNVEGRFGYRGQNSLRKSKNCLKFLQKVPECYFKQMKTMFWQALPILYTVEHFLLNPRIYTYIKKQKEINSKNLESSGITVPYIKNNQLEYIKRVPLNLTDAIQRELTRHYNKTQEKWTVLGHWRTYKSGKKIWVKPYEKRFKLENISEKQEKSSCLRQRRILGLEKNIKL